MKAMLSIAVLSILLAGLAGCTSTGARYASAAPATTSNDGATTTKFVEDSLYIAEVERAAQSQGVEVHWINPPVKRVTRND